MLLIIDYQQWYIYSGSETVTDNSYKPLQMTFSVVVDRLVFPRNNIKIRR
jgi:hypothetical protein